MRKPAMRAKKFFHATAVLLLCNVGILSVAQSTRAQPLYYVGGHVSYASNIYKANFNIVANSAECGSFTSGTGSGLNYGLLFEMPVMDQIRISARALFTGLGGTLNNRLDNGFQVYDSSTRSTVPLVRQHSYKATPDYASVDLLVRYAPFDFPLGFLLGPSIGLPVFSKAFTVQEQIVSPAGYLYPNNTLTQVDTSGNLSNANVRLAIVGGVGYDLPLGKISAVSPEITFSFPLTNVASGMQWKIFSLRAGVSVKFGMETPPAAPPLPPPLPPPPPPPPEPAAPVATLSSSNAADIHITETTVTETFPILPYIFFGKDSSDIPPRYMRRGHDSVATFREQNLPNNALGIYHSILDLTGKRLAESPASAIILTGTTDNKDLEKGNTALARARAESVKNYLVRGWEIDPSRISIQTRMLPDNPTNPDYPEGDEENRRVEIASDDESLFRPIVHANFSEYSMTPPTMTFNLGANAQAGVASWSLAAKRGDESFATFGDTGAPPKTYSWTLNDNVARAVRDSDHIVCALTIRDTKGRQTTSTSDVPVFKQKNDVEIGRLSLIVFDFDKSDISATNRELMEKFVAVAVHPASTVSIIGSTDRLGEAAHNQELSDARAQNVKKLLLGIKPDANITECKGIGQSKLLYDNSLSEGRYYCRTVAIDVRTPIDTSSAPQSDPH